ARRPVANTATGQGVGYNPRTQRSNGISPKLDIHPSLHAYAEVQRGIKRPRWQAVNGQSFRNVWNLQNRCAEGKHS
ncbi:MAG: hypothetical protein WD872_19615, partial [Pirellulaceae bacterium]